MKFLVDECVGPTVARWLQQQGYDVISIYDDYAGINDTDVLNKALQQGCILITSDKDFGEIVFKNNREHAGILLLRLFDERPLKKIYVLGFVLKNYSHDLPNNFVVATEGNIRIIKK